MRGSENGSVPEGWRVVPLRDAATVRFSTVDKKIDENELPVKLCNYTDVFYNRRIQPEMDLAPGTATPTEVDRWTLRRGDVLFTKDSETPTEIGVPSYVTNDMPDVLCGYHLGLARPLAEVVTGRFLARVLASRTSAREFARIANGVIRYGLTLEATSSLPLLVPPLTEQRAIATVLDAIDEAIEITEEIIATTERLRNALRQELLTRGLPVHHTQWKDVPGLGTTPAQWAVVHLSDIADVIGGATPARDREDYWGSSIPWVVPSEVTQLTDRYLAISRETITEAGMKAAGLRFIPTGSILLTSRATIGKTAITAIPVTTNQGFQNLVPKAGTSGLWLYYQVVGLRHELEKRGADSTFREISRGSVRSIRVVRPPLPEQHAIAAALDAVDTSIECTRDEREELESLKTSTADSLLRGLVRVPAFNRHRRST